MLTSCVNFTWYILKQNGVLKINISGLFNIFLRLLLDENSISSINTLAGKELIFFLALHPDFLQKLKRQAALILAPKQSLLGAENETGYS